MTGSQSRRPGPIKVLHVYKSYYPEDHFGVAQVIWHLAEGLAAFGVDSQVLTLSPTPSPHPIRVAGHVVHQAKRDLHIASTGLSFSVFKKFNALVRGVDLIHYHFPWPLQDLMHLSLRIQRPSLVTYHSDIVKQRLLLPLYRPLMNRFLNSVDRIVATSPQYFESSPVLQQYTAKTSIIPLGLPDRTDPSPEDLRKWRERVGTEFFLFIGALRYYKGLPFLLDAAQRTGLRVVIAGSGDNDDEMRCQAAANVTFVGAVSDADKEALLSLCRAFVFPSHLRSEAFGLALIEAARAGKPMISCEIGTGTSSVNISGVTGIVVPPADSETLSSAMQRLASDRDLALQLGSEARAHYQRTLQAMTMCSHYHDEYQTIVGN